MADILITGASGQIGTYLFKYFSEKYDVTGVDLKPFKEDVNGQLILCDLRKRDCVKDVINKFKPNTVIHLAAQVSVEKSWSDPLYDAENNIISTINLLDISAKIGVEKLIYFSSAAVYGNPEYVPIDENHPIKPLSPYGISKFVGELYSRIYSPKLKIIILRPFNVFSKTVDTNNPYSGVIARFIWRAKNKLPPIIYGDGKQTRDFIHVKDIINFVNIILNLDNLTKFEIFNLGTGKETSILELARIIISIAGTDVEPIFRDARPGDIRRSCADISKAKKLGFEPRTDLKKDIKEIFEDT